MFALANIHFGKACKIRAAFSGFILASFIAERMRDNNPCHSAVYNFYKYHLKSTYPGSEKKCFGSCKKTLSFSVFFSIKQKTLIFH